MNPMSTKKKIISPIGLPKDPVVQRDITYSTVIARDKAMICLEETCGVVFHGGQVCPVCGGEQTVRLSIILSGERLVIRPLDPNNKNIHMFSPWSDCMADSNVKETTP